MRACYTASISCALWVVSHELLHWPLASMIMLTVCAISFFFLWFAEAIDATKAKNNLNDNLWGKYRVMPVTAFETSPSMDEPVKIEVTSKGNIHEVLLFQDKTTFEPRLALFNAPEEPFPVAG